MPLNLQEKKDLVERYRRGVGASPHVYLIDYKGISVPAVTELRAQVRQIGGEYRVAKVLTDFAGAAKVLEFKAGLVEGRSVAGSEVKQIASLPSREALIAKLLFLLQSPISRFASVLAALPRQLVVVVDQVRQKKEGAGPAGD